MALKPVHGHHGRHHHAHHAHHEKHGRTHQAQNTHKPAEKPTQAQNPQQAQQPQQVQQPQPAQPAVGTPATAIKSGGGSPVADPVVTTPVAGAPVPAVPAATVGTPVARDEFAQQAQAPVNLTPGATGERKPPVGAVAEKPAAVEPNTFDWVGQLAPDGADASYDNGEQNCGPAAGAMIARECGYGEKMTDAQLVENLAQAGGTTELGTSGNGMIAMFEEMGMETAATPGADMTWINAQLAQGHYVTALGDYYQVPTRIEGNEDQTAGHYLDVSAYQEASKEQEAGYRVADPADEALSWLTVLQLQAFITSAPNGGFAIASWADPAAATTVL